MENLGNAAREGLAHGAIGYLITDWGDHGHWQHLPISFLPFAYWAGVSWSFEAHKEIDIKGALNLHAFEDPTGVMGPFVYDLGNLYKQCEEEIEVSVSIYVHYIYIPTIVDDACQFTAIRKGARAIIEPYLVVFKFVCDNDVQIVIAVYVPQGNAFALKSADALPAIAK